MSSNAPEAATDGLLTTRDVPVGDALLQRAVAGMNIDSGSTFADVADRPGHTTLVVFLRHYG